jgi:hypothetical protein
MSTTFKTVKDYFEFIRKIAINSQVTQNAWGAVKFNPKSKNDAIVRAQNPPLQFEDGATLAFTETVKIVAHENKIEREKYSFHYEKNGQEFFFRYDRDKKACIDQFGNPRLDHPENHLHVNQKAPRYMTHATSFAEVFQFIVSTFYEQK